jgi:hypothetical protein
MPGCDRNGGLVVRERIDDRMVEPWALSHREDVDEAQRERGDEENSELS